MPEVNGHTNGASPCLKIFFGVFVQAISAKNVPATGGHGFIATIQTDWAFVGCLKIKNDFNFATDYRNNR